MRTHIDLLNSGELLPCLIDKGLIDRDACRRDQTINGAELLDSLGEGRVQAVLLGHIGLDVDRLAAVLGRQGLKLLDGLGLEIHHGNIAAHLADCPRGGKADTLEGGCKPIARSDARGGVDWPGVEMRREGLLTWAPPVTT